MRKIEGSNLVFRAGDGRWLKICPPFWADAFDAEVRVTAAAQGRLTAPIPQILDSALIGDWRCLVSTHVPGVPIQDVLSTLGDADLEHIAGELGGFMRSFHDVEVPDFERAYGPWSRYLEERLAGAEALHRERGVEPARINEIAALLEARAGALRALGPAVLVHADLTAEHVMLTNHDGRWRLSGVLDLADAMHAPAALDLVTPFVELFRGRRTAQRGLMREAGIDLAAPFSETMMAIALQHSFIHFDAWFAPEIARGLTRVADIAAIVFPD